MKQNCRCLPIKYELLIKRGTTFIRIIFYFTFAKRLEISTRLELELYRKRCESVSIISTRIKLLKGDKKRSMSKDIKAAASF